MTEIVVVTSSLGNLPGLTQALKAIPIGVEEHPLMSFAPPGDWAEVDRALERASGYGAVAFTSPRAAEAVAKRIEIGRRPWPGGQSKPSVWAGGPATAAALGDALGAVRIPSESDTARWGAAGALARAMLDAGVVSPVLFLCGETHRDALPERLRGRGIDVDEVVCYKSVLASGSAARAAAAHATVLIVSSPSVADLLADACAPDERPDLVAVGPTTAATARDRGWPPAAMAPLPSVAAVTAAVQSVLAKRSIHE
jgi:uroporphyrinogen-III synthase